MKVIKRDGTEVQFDRNKIQNAIMKAMKYGSGRVNNALASQIAEEIENDMINLDVISTTISRIEKHVFDKLCDHEHEDTARAYEGYRSIQEFKRKSNTTDSGVLGLIAQTNVDVMNENSNKNAAIISTQRDLIAGEVSKDITRRKKLPTHIVQAHDDGVLHFHDMDYFMQQTFNCSLVNIKDMLDNGTVISKRKIDSPNSFQVACTVMTQIIAQVASSQYGK